MTGAPKPSKPSKRRASKTRSLARRLADTWINPDNPSWTKPTIKQSKPKHFVWECPNHPEVSKGAIAGQANRPVTQAVAFRRLREHMLKFHAPVEDSSG